MTIKEPSPINLNADLCSRCYICRSVCPFEAISLDVDKIPVIDVQKCMLCGLCAASCPTGIISLREYSPSSLVKIVAARKPGEDVSLVVGCRGSTSPDFSRNGTCKSGNENRVFLRVPCVGRLPLAFYLSALSGGIKNITVMQCSPDFCRFRGGFTGYSRLYALERLLGSLGYSGDTLTIIEGAKQANYTPADCVGCDKCVQVCPYSAITPGPLGTPAINYQKCTGCGACTVVCPHLALEIAGYEFKLFSDQVEKIAAQIKQAGSASPSILAFCCQWAEFSHLDPQIPACSRPGLTIMEIPCFNQLDPLIVLQAFRLGFDGVLAVGCSGQDCKSKEAAKAAGDNLTALEGALKMLKYESRFRVFKTSPRDPGGFEIAVSSFSEKLARARAALKNKGEVGGCEHHC